MRTYSAAHKLGTSRPGPESAARPGPARSIPGRSTVYEPITPLPMETLAELFVHPAGLLPERARDRRSAGSPARIASPAARRSSSSATTRARSSATVDRPDYHVQVAVDRLDGIITRLVESVGGEVTRVAEVVHLDPDAALPATTFEFEFPEGTTLLY